METKLLELPEKEYLLPGNRTCAGCGLSIAFRYILKALDGEAIFVVPASCLTVLGGMYPVSSVAAPWLNVSFPSTAASANGVVAGLKALGKTGTTVVAFAGDGGTVDIGIQALSGAAERNVDMLYICYDNEAYMNTGTQRSSATPLGAKTATTPVLGKQQHAKDMIGIMEAHNVGYIATATSSFPADLYDKIRKAKARTGMRYIHITTPCSPGWVFPARDTVKMGRIAVDNAMIVLLEIEDGALRLTGRSRRMAQRGEPKPIEGYVRAQQRFKGIGPEHLDVVQQWVTDRWHSYVKRDTALGG
ncbi:MAG: pyruvate synthase subunit beta [Nitrospiraceae bacterium]|nr:pyruvate synthase subunit beta [Nitrospiraceae bacterium]